MSKKIQITLPNDVFGNLLFWSEQTKLKVSALASSFIQRTLREELSRFKDSNGSCKQSEPAESSKEEGSIPEKLSPDEWV